MSLINDEILKEVGRFGIEFNDLDEAITMMARAMLECAEPDIAQILIAYSSAGRKLDLIGTVCKSLTNKYAVGQQGDAFLRQISSAKELVDKRNTVIHGSVKFERGRNPIALSKKRGVELSRAKLSELVGQIDRVAQRLIPAYRDFVEAVDKAREGARKCEARPALGTI